jgi:hypothetical protein
LSALEAFEALSIIREFEENPGKGKKWRNNVER